jgi:polyketide cyclase/dehydrase/lipid transport protein
MVGRALRLEVQMHLAVPGYQPWRGLRIAAAGGGEGCSAAPFRLGRVPAVTVTRHSDSPPDEAWARLVDWQRHGAHVPLTTVTVRPGEPGVGAVFVARTAFGRLGFDDPMEVVEWDPPRFCRIEKRGRVMRGWAELTVSAAGTGSLLSWREEAVPTRLPGFARPLADAATRRLLTRVLRRLLDDRPAQPR